MFIFHALPLRQVLGLLLAVLFCSACVSNAPKDETPPPPRETRAAEPPALDKAQQELAAGIASYENGSYKVAARQLQKALALGLKERDDQARAHKYQAFMHCVGGRRKQCRDEFQKAFEADPAFDLTPAEAGHPTWGPVFREVRNKARAVSK